MLPVYYYIMINAAAFLLYGIDKGKAVKRKYRISEATLIIVAVLGGPFGAFLGMHVFHHKTKKKKFYITIPILMGIYLLIILFCLYRNDHLW